MLIEGAPAARRGDATAHGGVIVAGSSTVFIGDDDDGLHAVPFAGAFRLFYETGEPVPDVWYELTASDGRSVVGLTDEEGCTMCMTSGSVIELRLEIPLLGTERDRHWLRETAEPGNPPHKVVIPARKHVFIAFTGWNAPWQPMGGKPFPAGDTKFPATRICTALTKWAEEQQIKLATQAFGSSTLDSANALAVEFANTNVSRDEAGKQTGLIFVYGYSAGGDSAVEVCQMLEEKRLAVKVLYTVDISFSKLTMPLTGDFSIPANVELNMNYYSPTGHGFYNSQPRKTKAVAPDVTIVANYERTERHGQMDEATEPLILSHAEAVLFEEKNAVSNPK